ncbi:MAG: GtrA family protein [Patescibacteria group bacterium]
MNIAKRFSSYFVIGLLTTFITFLLWNVLIWLGNIFFADNLAFKTLFSTSQFLASFIMIFPSFYLNRKITFGDKARKNSRSITVVKAYTVYFLSTLLSSLVTFGMQFLFNFEAIEILLFINLKIGRHLLQLVGIVVSMFINFFGQKLWIYR